MREEVDAYGQQLMRYLRTGHGYEIVERDDGYIDLSGSTESYFSSYSSWPDHIKEALGFAEGRILDIGCGAGRHALYLQGLGHPVVGVDISPLAVAVCRERGLERAENLAITQITSKLGTFDSLIMLGNNFGLFAGFSRAKWLLKRFYNLTSPEGRIIAESRDPYMTEQPEHTDYHRLNRIRGRMAGQLRIRIRFKRCIGQWFDYLLVSKEEMESVVEGTGWHIRRFFDGKNGTYVALIAKH